MANILSAIIDSILDLWQFATYHCLHKGFSPLIALEISIGQLALLQLITVEIKFISFHESTVAN
jgi:hypothetical protein